VAVLVLLNTVDEQTRRFFTGQVLNTELRNIVSQLTEQVALLFVVAASCAHLGDRISSHLLDLRRKEYSELLPVEVL
jgi:hypothetical protein